MPEIHYNNSYEDVIRLKLQPLIDIEVGDEFIHHSWRVGSWPKNKFTCLAIENNEKGRVLLKQGFYQQTYFKNTFIGSGSGWYLLNKRPRKKNGFASFIQKIERTVSG